MSALDTRPRAAAFGIATLLTLTLLAASTSASPVEAHAASAKPTGSATGGSDDPTVLSVRTYGHSVEGHVLRAFETGDRGADTTVVVMAAMHGNEPDGITIVDALRDGPPIQGVHLWLIPRMNPDGVLRDTRQNAHGVDLNRNFPVKWVKQTGYYDSGPRPSSERETRALERFLDNVDPDYIVSFHAPLHGVDTDTKDVAFARALSRNLKLPKKKFDCDGGCHGTMTEWFNKTHAGEAITVELGYHPTDHYLTVTAPKGLLKTFHATR